jgi:aldose 1-epimerase
MNMSISDLGKAGTETVHEIRIAGPCGSEAKILSYGATLRDLVVPVGQAKRRRVVLGVRSLEGYLRDRSYLGATVGRCINRIDGGRFTLDGKTYQLPINEGDHVHLHGGLRGFSRRVWRIEAQTERSATFAIASPDGEEGYPGAMKALCTYRIDGPGTLTIELTATTDAPTLANLGHHSYFTLQPGSDVRDHTMTVAADFYTPLKPDLIPTGEIREVAGTPYDFRQPRPIRAETAAGYDINFVLDQGWLPGRGADDLPVAARLVSPAGDLAMDLSTSEPGLQFYEGIRLAPTAEDFDGEPHRPYSGLCLEPQRFPDAVNRPHFSPVVLRPGETYRQISRFRFHSPAG